ncbi:AAA family ATPase, partial [bacterium]|nr:AAA family ATPase [bacterium]
TLLTIEAINKRGIPILGLVFNQEDGEDGLVLEDNPKIIKRFSGLKVFGSLPYSKDKSILYEKFTPIGGKIWSLLRKT